MNVAEKLAREIIRVTTLRCQYEECGREVGKVAVRAEFAPAIALMNIALENACCAAGVQDALTQIQALKELQEFTE